MSIVEMKWKITSSLNNLSEKALEEILVHLHQLENETGNEESLDKHFQRVLKEDANLLKRLAQ